LKEQRTIHADDEMDREHREATVRRGFNHGVEGLTSIPGISHAF
jgi:hypothetical protein